MKVDIEREALVATCKYEFEKSLPREITAVEYGTCMSLCLAEILTPTSTKLEGMALSIWVNTRMHMHQLTLAEKCRILSDLIARVSAYL